MPMIDVYTPTGVFSDVHGLAASLARTLMEIEQVPDIAMFRQNTAAFVHELPAAAISDVEGDSGHVRVQVLTNAGALDRDKQLAVVQRFSAIVADAVSRRLPERTGAHLTAAVPGGWGLWGHADPNPTRRRRSRRVVEGRRRLTPGNTRSRIASVSD